MGIADLAADLVGQIVSDQYEIEDALNFARLWRAGKLIGGDEDKVIFALLSEVERLRTVLKEIADLPAEYFSGRYAREWLMSMPEKHAVTYALVQKAKAALPDPRCKTEGCENFVESGEEYCTGCLDDQQQTSIQP